MTNRLNENTAIVFNVKILISIIICFMVWKRLQVFTFDLMVKDTLKFLVLDVVSELHFTQAVLD